MYYVYVLKSLKNGRLYIGYTKDLLMRLKQHNSGDTKSTKHIRPLELIYQESYSDKLLAINRERKLEGGQGRAWLKKILWDSSLS